jgi:hypothetical protein
MPSQKSFEEIKDSSNPEEINEFLIELAQHPKEEYFSIIDYFLNNLSSSLLDDVRVNLFYLIGELSHVIEVPQKYLDFLKAQYIRSDRWERNEIIKAFKSIVKHQQIQKKYVDLIATAVKEDYTSLKENAFECLTEIQNLEDNNLKKILLAINTNKSEILKRARKILRREILNQDRLFRLLNDDGFYKFIDKIAIRILLMTFFDSVIRVESFRERIDNSDWDNPEKQIFLDEIDTYEKILLKNR